MNSLIALADMEGRTPAERAEMLAPAYKNSERLIVELKAQEQVLAAKRKEHEDLQEQIREYLRTNMEECGVSEITAPNLIIQLSGGSEAVQIDDEQSIPEPYWRVKKEVDKANIKKAIKEGFDVPGASIVEGKKRLTVKVFL